MGGKDTPPPQCTSTSPLQSLKWDTPGPRSNTLGNDHRTKTTMDDVTRSSSVTGVQMDRQEIASAPTQWHSAPASPEQQLRCSRSDGSVSPIRQYMECIEPQTLRCAIVGDSGVGKTSLLLGYTTGRIPDTHDPTIYDKFSSKCTSTKY